MDLETLMDEVRQAVRHLDEGFRDDVAQQVVDKYRTRWPGHTAPDNVGAWLRTAVRNAANDHRRAEGRKPALPFGQDDKVAFLVGAVASRQPASLDPVRQELLDNVLSLLPVSEAEVFRCRALDGWSAAETAEHLGISTDAVHQRMSRARHHLQVELQRRPELLNELQAPHPHVYPDPPARRLDPRG